MFLYGLHQEEERHPALSHHNKGQHNDTQHNEYYFDIQHNDAQHSTQLSIC
jgi:hypothetical protein